MIESLPSFQSVFFVHYQCDNFNEGTAIHSLCIYSKGKAKEYNTTDERENIELYCQKVKELCSEGLVPIHWNQNRSFYGPDHICSRYKELTGNTIELEYHNEIQLSTLLVDIFGDDYVSHGRLDSLAELNNCNGNSRIEYRLRTFPANRVLLLSKIYHRLLHGKLITNVTPAPQIVQTPAPQITKITDSPVKEFPSYLLYAGNDKLALSLKSEFATEKGKALRLMLWALEQNEPPLIAIANRQGREIYEAMQRYFDRNIGTYQSIFNYKVNQKNDQADIDALLARINHILQMIEKGQ